ncbi:MAG: hypothetical protein ACKOUT_06410 [Novosphingobium sp.]
MSGAPSAIAGSAESHVGRDWEQLLKTGDIQFAPVDYKPKPPPEPPAWLQAIMDFLEKLLSPLGKLLGLNAAAMLWIMGGIILACVLLLVWRIVAPLIEARRVTRAAEVPDDWTPDRTAARALLEDADCLASEGRFDEATHLLLQRSVEQIARARPGLLHPATTAREIAGNRALPDRARLAFSAIAVRVERSFFALIPLGAEDWQAARTAYADFALAEISA